MRSILTLCAVLVGLAALPSVAASPLKPTRTSRIWFEGTSTVRDFSCQATRFSARVEDELEGARVEIPVSALDCRNGTMNEHMYKALDPNAPIVFEVRDYEAEGMRATIVGDLTIHGTTREVTLKGLVEPGETEVRFEGRHPVDMTEFGVKPPSLMLGSMKVHPKVTVRFDLGFPAAALQSLAPEAG